MVAIFRDVEATRKLFAKYKPTHVIHLAALGDYTSLRSDQSYHTDCGANSWGLVHEYEAQGAPP